MLSGFFTKQRIVELPYKSLLQSMEPFKGFLWTFNLTCKEHDEISVMVTQAFFPLRKFTQAAAPVTVTLPQILV